MSLPVRCFTCNKVIGQHENSYLKCIENNENIDLFFSQRNISRYCCKRMFNTTPYNVNEEFIECNKSVLPEQVCLGETKSRRIYKAI